MTAPGRKIEDGLCVGCGFCCDGTLHPKAALEPGGGRLPGLAGLELVDGGRAFRLPCPYSKNGCCSVYSNRPTVCRNYECKLLKTVKAGEMSLESAQEKVVEAKHLLAAVTGNYPDAALAEHRPTIWRGLQDSLATLELASRHAAAQSILDIAALDAFLDRWFGNKKPKSGTESSNSRSDEPERR